MHLRAPCGSKQRMEVLRRDKLVTVLSFVGTDIGEVLNLCPVEGHNALEAEGARSPFPSRQKTILCEELDGILSFKAVKAWKVRFHFSRSTLRTAWPLLVQGVDFHA